MHLSGLNVRTAVIPDISLTDNEDKGDKE